MSYLYVLVRSDLPPPQQAVQACHAVAEHARQGNLPADGEHPHLVLLAVADEEALEDYADKAFYSQLPYALFREADLNDEATAVAVGPLAGASRSIFASLKTAKLKEHTR